MRRANPDLVLLLEPGPEWEQAVRPLYPAYPYRIGDPLPNTYGLILLSKLPLEAGGNPLSDASRMCRR